MNIISLISLPMYTLVRLLACGYASLSSTFVWDQEIISWTTGISRLNL